jgi:hypothetical protein
LHSLLLLLLLLLLAEYDLSAYGQLGQCGVPATTCMRGPGDFEFCATGLLAYWVLLLLLHNLLLAAAGCQLLSACDHEI